MTTNPQILYKLHMKMLTSCEHEDQASRSKETQPARRDYHFLSRSLETVYTLKTYPSSLPTSHLGIQTGLSSAVAFFHHHLSWQKLPNPQTHWDWRS